MRHSKLFILALLGLAATACNIKEDRLQCIVPVSIRVSGLTASMDDDFPSKAAQDVADYAGVKAITLSFFGPDGDLQYTATQFRDDGSTYETFGNFTCTVPIGTYTMIVIGRGVEDNDEFSLTSPNLASYAGEPRETFCKTQEVTVTSSSPLNLDVTLERVVARLRILTTDNRSAGVAKIRATFAAGGHTFNPATGFAVDYTGFTVTKPIETAVGAPVEVFSYLFLANSTSILTVTVEALDTSDNVLFSKVITGVPFQCNKVTTLTGNIFTAGESSASFKLNTDWLNGTMMYF